MSAVLLVLAGAFGGGAVVLYVVFQNPEKVEKWVAMLIKLTTWAFKGAKRSYITHDIQGRVNEFASTLNREAPHCQASGVKLEWVDASSDVSEFFKGKRLIIRMRRHDDENRNFINASMIFVSKAWLPKAKKYLAPSQREAIDLFVARKLLEKEKPSVVDVFFEDYFSPKALGNERIEGLLDSFEVIDRTGMFFCVLVRELSFLGEKVYFGPRSDRIIVEVNELVEFLRTFSNREVGEDVPAQYRGAYCRSGIVIVAKSFKRELGDTRPYVSFAGKLLAQKIEQIYLLGSAARENKQFMDAIAREAKSRFDLDEYDHRTFSGSIKIEGKRVKVDTLLILLRSAEAVRVYDKEYQDQFLGEVSSGTLPDVEAVEPSS